jgi:hypothetical protein
MCVSGLHCGQLIYIYCVINICFLRCCCAVGTLSMNVQVGGIGWHAVQR